MRYTPSPLRPGMTAIAAVLALSATPLLAQTAEPAPSGVIAPAPVTPPSAPSVDASVIDAPVIASAPQAATPQPMTAGSTPSSAFPVLSSTVIPLAPETSTAAAPAATPAPAAKPHAAARATPAPVAARTVTATRTSRTTTAPAPFAPATPPVAIRSAAPVANAMPATAPAPAAVPQPVVQAQSSPSTQSSDDMLPAAGIAGLGLLALAGGALAFGRRKRRSEYDAAPDSLAPETMAAAPVAPTPVQPAAIVPPEPGFAFAGPSRTAALQPETAAPDALLPDGFDLSRFGRHVQAAYRGPTTDNPSLSLRRRLKHASFFDQRERVAAMPPAAQPDLRSDPSPASPQRATAARRNDAPVSRPNRQPKPGFRPAFQG